MKGQPTQHNAWRHDDDGPTVRRGSARYPIQEFYGTTARTLLRTDRWNAEQIGKHAHGISLCSSLSNRRLSSPNSVKGINKFKIVFADAIRSLGSFSPLSMMDLNTSTALLAADDNRPIAASVAEVRISETLEANLGSFDIRYPVASEHPANSHASRTLNPRDTSRAIRSKYCSRFVIYTPQIDAKLQCNRSQIMKFRFTWIGVFHHLER